MKILLLRPKPDPRTIGLQKIMICEPLELEYLAAAVPDHHPVALADMILEKRSLAGLLRQHQPQLVAITAYISHVDVVKSYARQIKARSPLTRVVVGGVHADVVPEDFLDPHIDHIISGDGISAFQKLVRDLAEGCRPEKIIRSQSGSLLPGILPDRSLSAPYRSQYYYLFHNPCALLKTSYGCPANCRFCFCRQITGGKYAARNLEDVMAELAGIREQEIYIVDDNFLVSQDRVEDFCCRLERSGLRKRFLIYGRADFIAAHPGTMARFARCGLRAVIVGLESPDPSELAGYQKGGSVAVNEAAVAILHQLGVDCYATLILGIDWGREDFRRLSRWLKKLRLRFINLQPLTPLPGTPLLAEYGDRLLVSREQFAQWDLANLVVQPGKLTVRQFYWQMLWVYFQVAIHPAAIWQNRRHGLKANLKLSRGVAGITWQYLKKICAG